MSVETRLRKLEVTATVKDGGPMRILVGFVDASSKEVTSMLATSPGMVQRWFKRENGETENQMAARIHALLGWDEPDPIRPLAGT